MKHIRLVSKYRARPAMATSMLEKQRNIAILGDLVNVIGDVVDTTQGSIEFVREMKEAE